MGTLDNHVSERTRPFLLMQGGPFYRIECRIGLIRKNTPLSVRRAVLAAVVTWLPLLIFSLIRGTALSGVAIPFLRDFSSYSRFLIGIPLLLLAELILAPRIAETAEQFLRSGVVRPKDFSAFDAAIERGLHLRDSVIAEFIIAVLAYIAAWAAYRQLAVHATTWYSADVGNGQFELTEAGWWQLLFAVPLMHFLIFRWLWRIFLWFRFLNSVSKLDLRLYAMHPDTAGGLGFVGEAQRFFGLLLFSYSCAITGVIANEVLYAKLQLQHFTPLFIAYVILAVLLTALPLFVFTAKLLVIKRRGLHEYSGLATAYTGSFHHKWIEENNSDPESLLGTSDIQSLADLGNSYAFIERMKPIPIDPKALIQIIFISVLPMSTLLLTVMPLKELLRLLIKVVA